MSNEIGDILEEKNALELKNNKLHQIINKIDVYELKIFVETDGRMVTNEFKLNMKELYDRIN